MKITIGRDAETSQLCLNTGKQTTRCGMQGSVPNSVSRQHCTVEQREDGTYLLQNLNIQNVTYVNGEEVQSKVVTPKDHVQLGRDRYSLDWKAVTSLMPELIDTSNLKKVWTEYKEQQMKFQVADRKLNAWRSITGIITMGTIAVNMAWHPKSALMVLPYVVAIGLSVFFWVKSYRDAAKVPERNQKLQEDFQRNYVCPKCGHFMGNQSYDILMQNSACPYCKVKYLK